MTFAFGAAARLSTEVRVNGTLTNATTISLTILRPDGTTDGPFTPVNDGIGLYHYDYTSAQAGRHIARWTTTGPVGADEESFDVAAQWAEAGVISLVAAKKQLNIDLSDTEDDEEIQDYLRSVTEICERYVGALVRRTVVEKHAGGYALALNHAPVLSLTSVVAIESGGVDQAVADLDLDGPTGIVQRKDGGFMCGPFRVTYVPGRLEIPPHVSQAAKILLQHMWETQRGTMGGVRVGGSDEVYDPRFGFTIPRRAVELLGDQPPGIA
ncbi:head-tail connector protein [Thermoactinospora rubra]|uniref:head-tail connector protein n=1 Tax=Thermoactinospora rubra TaxID=1088767 RepID=UPI000A11E164|nr:head-tail connector protein [Thermoactinospora rubra]